jgi:hypothetical protein
MSRAHGIVAIGDTSKVKLNLDNYTFQKARAIALHVCKWWKLEGFVIIKSSAKGYHAVFNRPVTWKLNQKVMGWVYTPPTFICPSCDRY